MFVQNTCKCFWLSGSFYETALMIAFIVTALFSYCLLLLLKCTTVWVWNVLNIKSMISIFLTFCSSTHFYSTNLVLWAYSTSLFFYHLSIKNYNRYRHMIVLSITLKLCSMRNFILFYGNIWDRVHILHSVFCALLDCIVRWNSYTRFYPWEDGYEN